jgi:hypothetical protein
MPSMPASAPAAATEPDPTSARATASAATGEPRDRTRATTARSLGGLAFRGLLQGGLLYGGAISLLHVRHNAMGALDALVLLGWSLLLYGAAGAIAAFAAGAALHATVRLTRRAASPATDRRIDWLALASVHAGFWVISLTYGLTYDQAPSWVTRAPAMLLWLLLLAAAATGGALLLSRPLLGLGATRRGRVAALALLVLLVGAHVALARPAVPRAIPPLPAVGAAAAHVPVAIVGVDGADWRVALPLVRAGRLPHLARLMGEGSWGPLATLAESNSAVIWATLYTGRDPADHGVHDFYTLRLPGMAEGPGAQGVYPVHRTFFKELALRLQRLGAGELSPIDRGTVTAPLLWEVAQAQGRTIGLVDGYFYSYPAPVLQSPASWFLSYGVDGLWRRTGARGTPPSAQQAARFASPPGLVAELGPRLAQPDFAWQTDVLLELLARRGQPDLVSLYSHEPDGLQHGGWRWHEPERYFGVDAAEAPQGVDPVAAFYERLDGFLGALRARLAPETVLIVVSDHGHSPTIFHEMDTQHRHGPPGMLLLHGPAVRAGELDDAHVRDLFPTVLHLLGLPIPRDGDGRLLVEALAPAHAAAQPPRQVASWDGLPRPVPAAPPDPAQRDEELQKLIDLGYVR